MVKVIQMAKKDHYKIVNGDDVLETGAVLVHQGRLDALHQKFLYKGPKGYYEVVLNPNGDVVAMRLRLKIVRELDAVGPKPTA